MAHDGRRAAAQGEEAGEPRATDRGAGQRRRLSLSLSLIANVSLSTVSLAAVTVVGPLWPPGGGGARTRIQLQVSSSRTVSYTHLRAHETLMNL
eukprot:3396743-Prymnesium_polylepis.1